MPDKGYCAAFIVSNWEGQNPRLDRVSGFRLLSLQSATPSSARCLADGNTDAAPEDWGPILLRPMLYGRGPAHGPQTAARREAPCRRHTPARASASVTGRLFWRRRSPSRPDGQGGRLQVRSAADSDRLCGLACLVDGGDRPGRERLAHPRARHRPRARHAAHPLHVRPA
jgi:hypothetical protein